jgi:HNH endonuclease
VSLAHPKQPRFRLDSEQYHQLRQEILRRDGWRCQSCGTRAKLEVHHKEFRSHCGDDSELNLIILCAPCHEQFHRNREPSKERLWLRNTQLEFLAFIPHAIEARLGFGLGAPPGRFPGQPLLWGAAAHREGVLHLLL